MLLTKNNNEFVKVFYEKRKFEYGCWNSYIQYFITNSPYKIVKIYNLLCKCFVPYTKSNIFISRLYFEVFEDVPTL